MNKKQSVPTAKGQIYKRMGVEAKGDNGIYAKSAEKVFGGDLQGMMRERAKRDTMKECESPQNSLAPTVTATVQCETDINATALKITSVKRVQSSLSATTKKYTAEAFLGHPPQ